MSMIVELDRFVDYEKDIQLIVGLDQSGVVVADYSSDASHDAVEIALERFAQQGHGVSQSLLS